MNGNFSPIPSIANLLNFSCFGGCGLVFHCGFNLQWPDGLGKWEAMLLGPHSASVSATTLTPLAHRADPGVVSDKG